MGAFNKNSGEPSESIDVLVIGAGIAGGASATALRRQGFEVLLAEKMSEPAKVFKGEYLQPKAVQIAKELGLQEIFEGDFHSSVTSLNFTDLSPNNEDVISQIKLKYPRGQSAKAITHHNLSKKLFQI